MIALKHSFGIIALLISLIACSKSETEPVSKTAPPDQSAVSFVNRVWKVSESTGVQPGQLYVFLSEGTLIITSTNSTPMLGKWSSDGKNLIMIEEGISYKVDILELTRTTFKIRSHNPGGYVDIALVPGE